MKCNLARYMPNEKKEPMNDQKKWIIDVKEDPDNPEELIIEFPDDLMEAAGWKPGDTINWTIEDDKIILTKKVE